MSIGIDRSRSFSESLYPQVPGIYTPTQHFVQRFKQDERHLNGEIIRQCIRYGELIDNDDGCACFRSEWGKGVAYYVIAGFHEDGYRIIITAWPHVHDRQAALKTNYWDEETINEIEELNARYTDEFETEYPQYSDWIQQQ